MYFYGRAYINSVLRLATRQSYRVVPSTNTGRIRSDAILSLLNGSRIGIAEPVSVLPCDLLTPEEAASAFGVTGGELRRWSRRKRNPIPHYRLTKNAVRYPKFMVGEWLKENS